MGPAMSDDAFEQIKEDANHRFHEGRYGAAVDSYGNILLNESLTNHQRAVILLNRASANMSLNTPETLILAHEDVEEAAELEPFWWKVQVRLAQIEMRENNWSRAYYLLQRAIGLGGDADKINKRLEIVNQHLGSNYRKSSKNSIAKLADQTESMAVNDIKNPAENEKLILSTNSVQTEAMKKSRGIIVVPNGKEIILERLQWLGEPINVEIKNEFSDKDVYVGPHRISTYWQKVFGGIPAVENLSEKEFLKFRRQQFFSKKDIHKLSRDSLESQLTRPFGGQQDQEYEETIDEMKSRLELLERGEGSSTTDLKGDIRYLKLKIQHHEFMESSMGAAYLRQMNEQHVPDEADEVVEMREEEEVVPVTVEPTTRASSRTPRTAKTNPRRSILKKTATSTKKLPPSSAAAKKGKKAVNDEAPKRGRGRPRKSAIQPLVEEYESEKSEDEFSSQSSLPLEAGNHRGVTFNANPPIDSVLYGELEDDLGMELDASTSEAALAVAAQPVNGGTDTKYFVAECRLCIFAAHTSEATQGLVAKNATVIVPVYDVSHIIEVGIDDEDSAIALAQATAKAFKKKPYGRSDGRYVVYMGEAPPPDVNDDRLRHLEDDNARLTAKYDDLESKFHQLQNAFNQQQRTINAIISGRIAVGPADANEENVSFDQTQQRIFQALSSLSSINASNNEQNVSHSAAALPPALAAPAPRQLEVLNVPSWQWLSQNDAQNLRTLNEDPEDFIRCVYRRIFNAYETFGPKLPEEKCEEFQRISFLHLSAVNDTSKKEVLDMMKKISTNQRKSLRNRFTEVKAEAVAYVDHAVPLRRDRDVFVPADETRFDRVATESGRQWPLLVKDGEKVDTMFAHRPDSSESKWVYFIITRDGGKIFCNK